MANRVSGEELKNYAGRELAPSDWVTIRQDRIDGFADLTGDHQFIHVDPERAGKTPLGSTIAHGFLTLSLIPALTPADWPELEGTEMVFNYGLDRVRFLSPVKVDCRVRLRTRILSVTEKRPGQYLIHSERTLEIEGSDTPAYVAVQLALVVGRGR